MKIKLILKCRHCSHLRLSEVAAEKWKCFKTGEAIRDPDAKIPARCPLWSIAEFYEHFDEETLKKIEKKQMNVFGIETNVSLRKMLEDDGTPKRHGRQTK